MTQTAPQATPTRPATHIGGPDGALTDEQARAFVHEQPDSADLAGRSVCVLAPDGARSCPHAAAARGGA
jgi:lactate racemase